MTFCGICCFNVVLFDVFVVFDHFCAQQMMVVVVVQIVGRLCVLSLSSVVVIILDFIGTFGVGLYCQADLS